jgi:hypothetical protein
MGLALIAGLAACCIVSACRTVERPRPLRVLFVGNSLTYYNDLPGMLQALHRANPAARVVDVDMIAQGGMTMAQHLASPVLGIALEQKAYDVVVLQEFGGWPLCSSGALPACEHSADAMRRAITLVREHHARPIWYSTWQRFPDRQIALSKMSATMAEESSVAIADVGLAMKRYTDLGGREPLLESDGHPTRAGSWLAAAAIYRTMSGGDFQPLAVVRKTCRTPWQGQNLSAAKLASRQTSGLRDCTVPSPELMREIGNAVQ